MRYFNLSIPCLILFVSSCKKITDISPYPSHKGPSTLDECQAILDNDMDMNGYGEAGFPSMSIICADEYNVTQSEYDSCTLLNRQAMTWAPMLTTGNEFPDYDNPYRTVSGANLVLTTLPDISSDGQLARWQGINSSAHFFRAYAFYELAQLFAPVYDDSYAKTAWGIPLPSSPDINQKISRATLQETYDQILSDLHASENMLPRDDLWRPTRPSKAAVYAQFARVYLSMRNYRQALLYSDSTLQLQAELMHYDTVSRNAIPAFHRWNPEVIFSAAYYRSGPSFPGRSRVDSTLIRSYQPGDLRRSLFITRAGFFLGMYDEDAYGFEGLATDEIYLIRSECQARLGDFADAIAGLNYLLNTRWADSSFIPYTATDADDALKKILSERKKELLFRGTRWTDLRRLNMDSATAQSISRTVNGHTYTLLPKDPRWTLLIPDYVLRFNPGMPQNTR